MATDLLDDITFDHRGYRGRHRRAGLIAAAVLGAYAIAIILVSQRRSSQPA